MGLFNRLPTLRERALSGAAHWQIAVILVVVALAFASFGDTGRETFKYDRLAIADGEYWRLVTGHFVHLGTTHLVLNLAGLVLVWLLVGRYYDTWRWAVVLLVALLTMTAGFWLVDTHLLWYVGLSGVLHGLLVAGTIQGFRELPSESVIIAIILAGKIGWEQLAGPMPGSESVSGGAVVVNAHLYGAIGGIIAGALFWRSAADKRPI
jgi:rhomboid family GlyGly-CTERM serine protease